MGPGLGRPRVCEVTDEPFTLAVFESVIRHVCKDLSPVSWSSVTQMLDNGQNGWWGWSGADLDLGKCQGHAGGWATRESGL